MALEAPKSLSYVRGEVMSRCTLNTGGDRGGRAKAVVDSMIRSAIRQLVAKNPWLVGKITKEVDLVTDVSAYDFPDELDPSRIELIDAREVATQEFYPVAPSPSQAQRNALLTSTLGRPSWYWFDDGQINVTPLPDPTLWDILRLSGFAAVTSPVADGDEITIDAEAVVQRAEILARPRLGLGVTQDMKDQHLAYIRELKKGISEGGGLLLGGATSARLLGDDDNGARSPNTPYDSSWQPPGGPGAWGP